MSWFHRAVSLSPILRSSCDARCLTSTTFDGDSDEDVAAETRKGKDSDAGMPYHKYKKWCLLREDNVRFWDCFGMLRSEPTLSTQTAIQRISETPNSEYFSHDLITGLSYYFSNESEIDIELLRLTVENPRLHAVLWVLTDNPNIQLDAMLGAIFRLNDEEFNEKFQFEYEPGCFSSKRTILSWKSDRFCPRGAKKELYYYKKRCRSSTPLRSTRLRRNSSDKPGHLVSKISRVPRGQNISGNRKCYTYTKEPSRKRPYFLLMPTLMTENPRRWSCKDVGLYSPMDNIETDKDEDDPEHRSYSKNNNASSGLDNTGSDDTTNFEFNGKPSKDLPKESAEESTMEHTTAPDYHRKRSASLKVRNILLRTKKHRPCSLRPRSNFVISDFEMKKSQYKSSIDLPSYELSQKIELRKGSIVQFQNALSTPKVFLSDRPRPSIAPFTPYSISHYSTPSAFISRHMRMAEKMLKTPRNCDLYFCLKSPEDAMKQFNLLDTENDEERRRESSVTSCGRNSVFLPAITTCQLKNITDKKEKKYVDDASKMAVRTSASNDEPARIGMLRGCKSQDICKQQKESVLKLGGYHYTKPLLDIVSRGILCSKNQH